jgi:hypothetical protein
MAMVELGDDVGRNAAVRRLADDAGDPDVGTRAGDVAIVADQRVRRAPPRGNESPNHGTEQE